MQATRTQWHRHSCLCVLLLAVIPTQLAAAPKPPSNLKAAPDNKGDIVVTWEHSSEDDGGEKVAKFRLHREAANLTTPDDIAVNEIDILPDSTADPMTHVDRDVTPDRKYTYRLIAVGADGGESESIKSATVVPIKRPFLLELVTLIGKWIDFKKLPLLGFTILICGGLIVSTELARRGKPIYIRPIAGLQAIEEAVGRATEMGRPMLYVPGIQDMNEIQTVAGVTVLSHVAQTAAQYDMQLDVPTSRALVMTAARDSVEAGCLKADRPDVYDESKIYYVTDDQFSFVAHVGGRMIREKPAACFYIGQFFAESLLLAETGNSVGAIQIAGTAEASQLPFFVAACDYTLLGEEMFAASAYLSREPEQLGMLRGQDFAKLLAGAMIIGGCLWFTWLAQWELLKTALNGP